MLVEGRDRRLQDRDLLAEATPSRPNRLQHETLTIPEYGYREAVYPARLNGRGGDAWRRLREHQR